MAKLYFYYASMNAGKSAALLQADFNYRERGMVTMLWTAALDERAGAEGNGPAIASRIGLAADAHRYDGDTDLWARVSAAHAVQPLACVLVDEAQWLSAAQVWQLARIAERARHQAVRDLVEDDGEDQRQNQRRRLEDRIVHCWRASLKCRRQSAT
jgi:thymidine kinase